MLINCNSICKVKLDFLAPEHSTIFKNFEYNTFSLTLLSHIPFLKQAIVYSAEMLLNRVPLLLCECNIM